MGLIWFGLGLIVVGTALGFLGKQLDERKPGIEQEEAKAFFVWFLEVLKKAFAVIFDPRSSLGKKVAALGSVLFAAGGLLVVVGAVTFLV